MVIAQGDVCWADLAPPRGSEPGYRRPVVVLQCNALNESNLATVVCAIVTGNLMRAKVPGHVLLPQETSGLPQDSLVNLTQLMSVDRRDLSARVGRASDREMARIFAALDLVIGR